ncbi:MAG: prephenate dehydrogenase [Candidatus Micrarchaeota archaeon]
MRIAIIGTGNIGSWLTKEFSSEHEIAVYNRTLEKAELLAKKIKKVRVLSGFSELNDFAPELLINAVSLPNTVSVFQEAVKYIPKGCVICDVASIKGEIPKYYKESGFKFVSVHPMFGPTFANIKNLSEESAVIIKESDLQIAAFFRKFFQSLKLKIFEYTFDEHDKIMAYSLTIPFISTLVFAACIDKTTVPGTTFKKHIHIAKGLLSENDWLLAEILFNLDSLKELEKIISRLEFLKHIIKGKDYEEAKRFFRKLRKNVY